MTISRLTSLRALYGCALLASSAALMAQTTGDASVPAAAAGRQASETAGADPARWYHDDGSRATRLKILHKELGAALQEADKACRQGPAASRSACLKDAQANYQKEMAGASAQVDAAVGGSVTTTTTTTGSSEASSQTRADTEKH